MIEIKDEKIKKIIFDANNKLKNLNFQTHIDRSESAECTFIYARHNEHILTLWLDVFDDYEIIMIVTQFFRSFEYRSYVGDLDTIFEKFKSDMEKHFDKYKQ